MAKLPAPRSGKPLEIRSRPIEFSYWPMYRRTRRYGVHSQVYTTNPWALIRTSIEERCSAGAHAEASACVLQAEHFFRAAARTDLWAAKPLLFYYSFMNLAKAFALTSGVRRTFEAAQHGVSARRDGQQREIVDAYLEAHPPHAQGNVFGDLWTALSGHKLKSKIRLDVPRLMPQIIAGHRIWCAAAGRRERFLALRDIRLLRGLTSREIWLELSLFEDDLARLDLSRRAMLQEADLSGLFRDIEVSSNAQTLRTVLRFEQVKTMTFGQRPSDKVPDLISTVRHRIWATATTVAPFRRYYLYLAPPGERPQVLPQLMSIYAVMFYFGSITRYRPQQFDEILNTRYGAFVQELLSSQPAQFLYLMASEFAKRDVVRAPLV